MGRRRAQDRYTTLLMHCDGDRSEERGDTADVGWKKGEHHNAEAKMSRDDAYGCIQLYMWEPPRGKRIEQQRAQQ